MRTRGTRAMGYSFIVGLALANPGPGIAQESWESAYRVGQQISFTISENPADAQSCVISENEPGGVMRVKCNAFKHWGAGTYIVYSERNIVSGAVAPSHQPAPPIPEVEGRLDGSWESAYHVGQKVKFSISENPADLQDCTVVENESGHVMRVRCNAFKHWGAGTYIVYSPRNIGASAGGADAGPTGGPRVPQVPQVPQVRQVPQVPQVPQVREGRIDGSWESGYHVGQKVIFSISENPADFQDCTVVENESGSVMRVRCAAFKHWGAGTYIVYSQRNIQAQ